MTVADIEQSTSKEQCRDHPGVETDSASASSDSFKLNPDLDLVSTKEKIAERVKERNSWESYKTPSLCSVLTEFFTIHKASAYPSQKMLDEQFPIHDVDWEALKSPKDAIQATWVGHSTLFVQMGGWNILTDPLFSKRASPLQFIGGIKRCRKPAFTLEDLMLKEKLGLDVVLISHNHYDHLDYNTITKIVKLSEKVGKGIYFIVPLGLKKWFTKQVPEAGERLNTIIELDWHEQRVLSAKSIVKDETKPDMKLTALPMQHWSSRSLFDKDKSLWCGFKVEHLSQCAPKTFMFSGDTGWFDGLYDIGRDYGPFDLAAIPIGAYEPREHTKYQHINPEEAVQLMEAIKAKRAIPVHWGTFPLTKEPILEPKQLLEEAIERIKGDAESFSTLCIGGTIHV